MQEKITTQEFYWNNSKISGGSRNGPGRESYTGLERSAQLDGKWSKDLEWLQEGPFKGSYSADDVIPHHYGVCGICREFDDAVYVTIPATVICGTKVAGTGRIKPRSLQAVTRADGPSN